MNTPIKRNKPLSNSTYKKMDATRLVMLFNPMITNLLNRFSEDYYKEDMRQDLILELIRLQKAYRSTKGGPRFPAYIKMYMLNAAGESKARNAHAIYTCPSQIRKMIKENRELPTSVEFPDEEFHINYDNLYTIRKDDKESNLFSVLKIILKKIKDSEQDQETKTRVKNYIRDFLETNNSKKFLNKKLKKLLRDTVLHKIFDK